MIKFYNSISRKLETFEPIKAGHVSLYTCGPTVYNTAHIGNFRTFLFEDLLKRFLIEKGYIVDHVMNITDVDDKTIKKAIKEQKPLKVITDMYADLFFKDSEFLRMNQADNYPRATDHIEEMIQMIQGLVEKGHAYKANDNSIYFNIESFKEYGRLANIQLTEQRSTDRVQSDEYTKDNPHDFALWKTWKEEDGSIYWDSPWGRGRPGWHIECSAMSTKYLGDYFDIHCGGVDNVFPHHENEIAQSVCASGKPFVKYWMHSEHLMIDKNKMSKSSGNFYNISDLKQINCTAEMVRYIMLATHYRSKLQFSDEKIKESRKVIQRISDFKDRLEKFEKSSDFDSLPQEEMFLDALGNDLDSPRALAVFFDWLRQTNSLIDKNEFSSKLASSSLQFINMFDNIFGLVPGRLSIPPEILELVKKRDNARKSGDWDMSDKMRNDILEKGYVVEDTPSGATVKKRT